MPSKNDRHFSCFVGAGFFGAGFFGAGFFGAGFFGAGFFDGRVRLSGHTSVSGSQFGSAYAKGAVAAANINVRAHIAAFMELPPKTAI
jgi:hypothetical protein